MKNKHGNKKIKYKCKKHKKYSDRPRRSRDTDRQKSTRKYFS